MLKISERENLKAVKEYLQYKGWRVWRINNAGIYNKKSDSYYFHGDKGLPDLVCIKPPRLMFLEIKSSTGVATKEQGEFLEALNNCLMFNGGVVRSIEDVEKILLL